MWLQSGVTFPHVTCPDLGPPAVPLPLGEEELTFELILGQEWKETQESEDTLFPVSSRVYLHSKSGKRGHVRKIETAG